MKTEVGVRLQCKDVAGVRSAVVTVRDHGPGVPEAELANIFCPFYRVADARDRRLRLWGQSYGRETRTPLFTATGVPT